MKKIIIISIALLFLSFPVLADDLSFCTDLQELENLESIAKKYPDDIPVQILHALRIGLCVKINQNSITTTEAIHLYNDMLDTVANKRGEEEEQEKKEDL